MRTVSDFLTYSVTHTHAHTKHTHTHEPKQCPPRRVKLKQNTFLFLAYFLSLKRRKVGPRNVMLTMNPPFQLMK